jgi:hypothetical protein
MLCDQYQQSEKIQKETIIPNKRSKTKTALSRIVNEANSANRWHKLSILFVVERIAGNAYFETCVPTHLSDSLVMLLDLVHEGVVSVKLVLERVSRVLERRHRLQLVLDVEQPKQNVLVDLAESGVVQRVA